MQLTKRIKCLHSSKPRTYKRSGIVNFATSVESQGDNPSKQRLFVGDLASNLKRTKQGAVKIFHNHEYS